MEDQVSRFFKRPDWCRPALQYLALGELMTLAVTSKKLHQTVSIYLGSILKDEGVEIDGVNPVNYLKLYREVHFKSVIILQMDSLNLKEKVDVFSQTKITKKTLFVERIITDFTYGIKFTGYYFKNQELCLIRSYDYLTQTKNSLSRDTHCRFFENIRAYSLDARHAIFLDTEHTLRTLIYLKDKKINDLEDRILDTGVKHFVSNYNYLAYLTQSNEVFLLARFSNLNLGQMVKYRVVVPSSSLILQLGINLYLRSPDLQQTYFLQLSQLDPVAIEGNQLVKCVTAVEFTSFPSKTIGRIFTGLRDFLPKNTLKQYMQLDLSILSQLPVFFRYILLGCNKSLI